MFVVHHDTTAAKTLWYETKINGAPVERILSSGYFIKFMGKRVGVTLRDGALTLASFIEDEGQVTS